MNKTTKIIILVLIITVLVFLVIVALKSVNSCDNTFYIRNAYTKNCEIKVGCSLPAGIIEDPTCKSLLLIDGNRSQQELRKLGESCKRWTTDCEEGLECYPYDGGICITACPQGFQRMNATLCSPGV